MIHVKNTYVLICEELILHLFHIGCTRIQVRAKGRRHPRAELIVLAEADPLFVLESDNKDKPMQVSINESILRFYDRSISYRFRNRTGIYSVFPELTQSAALTKEILAYYNQDVTVKETVTEQVHQEEKKAGKPVSGAVLLLQLARKHPDMAAAGLMLRLIRHLAALMLPVFASNMIQAMSDRQAFLSRPICMNLLFSCLALAVNLSFAWLDNHVYHRFTRTLENSLKMAIIEKLQSLSFTWHRQTPEGKLFSKIVSDVQFVKLLLYDYSPCILFVPEDLLFVLVVSFIHFPPMVLIFAVLVMVYFLLIRAFSEPVRKAREQMRRKTENSNAMVREMLMMDQITRSHGLEQNETRRFRRLLNLVQESAGIQDNIQLRLNNIGFGLSQGFRLTVLSVSIYLACRGYLAIGSVVLFQALLEIMIASVQRALNSAPQITQGIDSLASINELLSERDIEKNGSVILPKPVRGEVELRNVCYRYGDNEPVLDDVSLSVPAGTSAAIVGESGTGKTTILGLILSLLEKESGQLLIDGIDVDELEKTHYRHSIAVVPQTPVLFSGTLWENLTYGLETCSSAHVEQVLRQVGLESLIHGQADGLNMRLLEGGSNVSGGQRQRIAIARALLRNPRIILLDEATSALDEQSEGEVQAAIEAAMHTCTVIIVAHRLNTIKKADVIYELKDGKAFRFDSYEEYMTI